MRLILKWLSEKYDVGVESGAPYMIKTLLELVNSSIKSGIFPSTLKSSN
jgi:hypothetical protein